MEKKELTRRECIKAALSIVEEKVGCKHLFIHYGPDHDICFKFNVPVDHIPYPRGDWKVYALVDGALVNYWLGK